ncbi:calcium/sodium antiporter [Roseibacillus ishigakijimensis]|uniref:Calcium/sodium antiporter n=1 Tax=Roseibacillus ishigakijimensis TaxID=454146 RepID=A0A934RM85_9BACT|nr:calcium/sodium antiporter [Roseibacillus ishigakijimensis]MBK1833380.1 calcium/sodium antiporter [Roseibacillus ishigakijimensis]
MLAIIFGMVLLYFGAEGLVRGSARLAARFGIPPLIIGLTIVAFGTSAPELTVSLSAALRGAGDVAVGNALGSNIFNIAVILGLTALIQPPRVHQDLIRREIPFLIVVTLLACGLVAGGGISRLAGGLLFLLLCAYTAFSIRQGRRSGEEEEGSGPAERTPLWQCALFIVLGLAVLVAGSHLFVLGAVEVARGFGVSEAVIGLTIVAAGTSLPELATSVVAAVKKEADVAIGNIVGSNIFNILCILGLTAVVSPLEVVGIGLRDALVMLAFSVVLLPFAWSQKSISRWEGGFFLLAYGGYLALLWPR